MNLKNNNSLMKKLTNFLHKKSAEFSSIIKNKPVEPNENDTTAIIKALTLVIILTVVYTGLNTNHYLSRDSYDGSNTINISSLNLKEIGEVLSKEQNFPFYYYIIHFLLTFDSQTEFFITLFQLSTWALSLLLFHKLLEKFVSNRLWQSVGFFIYTITPTIVYYSYYPRMYGIINLIVISLMYLIQKYLDKEKTLYVVESGILLILLSFLHLSGLFIIAMVTINYLLTLRKKTDKLLILLFFFLSVGLIHFQIFQKNNPQETYLLRGLSYLSEVKYSFLYYLELLFIGNITPISLVPVFALSISALYLIKSNGFYDKKRLYLYLNLGFFVLYCLTQKQFSNYRHYIFLTPALLLIIIEGLEKIIKNHKVSLAAVITAFYLLYSLIPLIYNYYLITPLKKDLCIKISELKDESIVTDYLSYNFINYCNKTNKNILIMYKEGIYFSNDFSNKEILIKQAVFGGTVEMASKDSPQKVIDYSKTPSIKKFLEEQNFESKTTYLINSTLPRKSLNQYEISVMRGCKLENTWKDIIYIFNCE